MAIKVSALQTIAGIRAKVAVDCVASIQTCGQIICAIPLAGGGVAPVGLTLDNENAFLSVMISNNGAAGNNATLNCYDYNGNMFGWAGFPAGDIALWPGYGFPLAIPPGQAGVTTLAGYRPRGRAVLILLTMTVAAADCAIAYRWSL